MGYHHQSFAAEGVVRELRERVVPACVAVVVVGVLVPRDVDLRVVETGAPVEAPRSSVASAVLNVSRMSAHASLP